MQANRHAGHHTTRHHLRLGFATYGRRELSSRPAQMAAELRFLAVPYYLGREHARFTAGVPLLAAAMSTDDVRSIAIPPGGELASEVSDSFAMVRELAEAVRETVAAGGLPVVLAVNCFTAIGTVAGLETPSDLGVVWFDGHSDFDTPDVTTDGFIDGMGLAMLAGNGWRTLRASVRGLKPVPAENVLLVGARKLDLDEVERLAASGISHLPPRQPLEQPLDRLAERARGVYVHIDLDVLDPSEGRTNMVVRAGGMSKVELLSAVDAIGQRFEIRALAFTAYVPDYDSEQRIPSIARAVVERIALARRQDG